LGQSAKSIVSSLRGREIGPSAISGAWRRGKGLAASSERAGLRPPSLSRVSSYLSSASLATPNPRNSLFTARLPAAPVAAEWPTHNTRIMEGRLAELRVCFACHSLSGLGHTNHVPVLAAQSSMDLCRPSALADASSCLAPLTANLSFFLPYHTTRFG
jgi:hypothetical protein